MKYMVVIFFCISSYLFSKEKPHLKIEYLSLHNISYYPQNSPHREDEYKKNRCVLDLYFPKNIEGFSTIIWFHGGGLKYNEKDIPEQLKRQKVAIIAPNYRLYPKVKSPTYLQDAAAAVAWAFENIEKYGGSKNKIFLSGHSAGGYLASMIGLDKRWLQAYDKNANDIAGLIPFSGHTITHFTIRSERGLHKTKVIVDDLAPLNHIRKDAPPLFLITGDREMEMLGRYEENAFLFRMMKVVGHQQTKLQEIKNIGHNMTSLGFPFLLDEVNRISKNIER